MAARRIDIYWFRRRQNFGDAIAPHLVARFAEAEAVWTRSRWSEAVVIGSVAGRVSHGYRGVVVGVGKIDESMTLDLSRARVLGLRGELTWRGSGASGEFALGDSGLLAAELVGGRTPTQYTLGIVPHYQDRELAGRYPEAEVIDVGDDPIDVVRKIAACERIISSSLHGLITADAFGIARRWEPSERLRGGRFKFADYASGLGIKLEPDVWATAPASTVAGRVAELRDAFRELPQATQLAKEHRHERFRRGMASAARLVPQRRRRE